MSTVVKSFRTDRETSRMIRQLRRKVQPTRFNAKHASNSDVIRAGVKTLYAQIAGEVRTAAPRARGNEVENGELQLT
jgi:Arc/MetJ-type ribon-helix-helix transcriptional regulator